MANEIRWPQDAAPLTTQQVLDSTPVMAANPAEQDKLSYVTVGQLANKTKEIVEITGELIDPIAPGTAQAPAAIPAGPAGQKRKFTPAPGFYQGFPEVTSDKQWYFYWNGSVWQLVDLGLLPQQDISGLATKESLSYKADLVTGKNKFNKDAEQDNGFFLNSSGARIANPLYFISEPIPLPEDLSYDWFGWAIGAAFNAWYDANDNLISVYNTKPVNRPSNAVYTRLSGLIANKGSIQFQVTDGTQVYEPYAQFVDPTQIKLDLEQAVDITNTTKPVSGSAVALGLNQKIDISLGKNLFNKDNPTHINGQFLRVNGALQANAAYFVSEFIPVLPNTLYQHFGWGIGGAFNVWYDEDLNFISSYNTTTAISPSNVAYVRLSGLIANINAMQFQVADGTTVYEPYTTTSFLDEVRRNVYDRPVEFVMPSKFYFVSGFQSAFYYENMLRKNIEDAATILSTIGVSYRRLIAFLFTNPVASGATNWRTIYSLKRTQERQISYVVNATSRNSGKTLNVLCAGDSFTDLLTYVRRFKQLLEGDGATINLIGTTGDNDTKVEGLSGGTIANTVINASAGVARIVDVTGVTQVPQTSHPGTLYIDANGAEWNVRGGKVDGSGNGRLVVTRFQATNASFANFPASGVLTKKSGQTNRQGDNTINYSNPTSGYFNQFINPSTGVMDIGNYITRWGFNVPDLVLLQFTYNDLPFWATEAQIQAFLANIKVVVDHIHTTFPSCKVIFSIEPFGSISANTSAARTNGSAPTQDVNGKKLPFLRAAELLYSTYENDPNYNTFFHIMPAYAVVDLVNGYGTSTVTPLAKYPEITERSGADGVHPNTVGMEQIGELAYQYITGVL